MVSVAYGSLALVTESARIVKSGAVVPVRLLCGCSSGLWNYLVTWVAYEGDSVESLASRFGVSMGSIEAANGFSGVTDLVPGDIYYIPLDSGCRCLVVFEINIPCFRFLRFECILRV